MDERELGGEPGQRYCRACGRWVPLEQFPLRRKGGQRRQPYCRDCKARYQRQWYLRNRERHVAAVTARRDLERAANRDLLAQMKHRPCTDCGVTYPPYVMDFDHVRGDKACNIGEMVSSSSTSRLREEMGKCEVVCANCHRERTFGPWRRGGWVAGDSNPERAG